MNPSVEAFLTYPMDLPSVPLWLLATVVLILFVRAKAGK